MGNLAVTGITGKSGKYFWNLVLENESLIKHKWDAIHLFSRNIESIKNIDKKGLCVEYFEGDLSDDGSSMSNFTKECDTLLHIAGIHWSIQLVTTAIKNGVKRLILVHTTGIYSKYKAAGEEYRQIDAKIYKMCEDNNVALTILRPTMIYGDVSDRNVVVFIKMVDKFKIMPTVGGAHYELQPVHCADLGKAYYDVLMNPDICNNKDYVLSGGKPLELRDMFDEIAKNLGVKRKYLNCPYWIAYTGAWLIYLLSVSKIDYREKVQRLVEPRVYGYEDAAKDFNYVPRTFSEGIVDEVKQYLENKNN